MLLRTENIAEDERFYKAISGLDDKTGQETIEHGNASPRKCEFKPICSTSYLMFSQYSGMLVQRPYLGFSSIVILRFAEI